MAELKVYLPKDLDKRFRMLAMSVFGYGRGSLSEAAVQAFTKWCEVSEARKIVQAQDDSSRSSSDPASRADERPRIVSAAKGDDSGSAKLSG